MNELLDKAIELATTAHAGQYRKKQARENEPALPYITHPIRVLELVYRWGIRNSEVLAAAVCHDVLEDTDIKPEILKEEIGLEAYAYVQYLTFSPEAGSKDTYMASFGFKPVPVLIIKLADRILNTQDFIFSDGATYAPIYWHKAYKLFETYQNRRHDIRHLYREEMLIRIDQSLKQMQIMVTTVSPAFSCEPKKSLLTGNVGGI